MSDEIVLEEELVEAPVVPQEEQEGAIYDADDFFVFPGDPGVRITPVIRGRKVPMFIKRGVNMEAAFAARNKASRRVMTKDGQIKVQSLDEAKMNIELLLGLLVSWPFTRKDPKTGEQRPVPITEENVRCMVGDAVEAVLGELEKLVKGKKEALAPFENR